ncbi:MAG: hypothetical protein K2J89_02325 [Clostridia bacterium]|nr:hypothetical protein [Clostridia bacterium]
MNRFCKNFCVVLLIAFAILSLCCFGACKPNGEKKDIAVFDNDSSDITYKDIEKKDGIIATENFVSRNLDVIDEFCKDNERTVLITNSNYVISLEKAAKYLGVDENGELAVAPICVVSKLYEQEFDIQEIFYDKMIIDYKSKINELGAGVEYQPYFIRLYAQNEKDENVYVGTARAEMMVERMLTDDKLYDKYDINYNISISLQEGYAIESFDMLAMYDGEFYLESIEDNIKVVPENFNIVCSNVPDTEYVMGDYECKVKTDSPTGDCEVKINRVYKYLKSCDLIEYLVVFKNLKLTAKNGYPEFDEEMSPNYFSLFEFKNDWFKRVISDGFNLLFPNL